MGRAVEQILSKISLGFVPVIYKYPYRFFEIDLGEAGDNLAIICFAPNHLALSKIETFFLANDRCPSGEYARNSDLLGRYVKNTAKLYAEKCEAKKPFVQWLAESSWLEDYKMTKFSVGSPTHFPIVLHMILLSKNDNELSRAVAAVWGRFIENNNVQNKCYLSVF